MRQGQPVGTVEGRRIACADIVLGADLGQFARLGADQHVMQIADPFVIEIGQVVGRVEDRKIEVAGAEVSVHLVGIIGLHIDLGGGQVLPNCRHPFAGEGLGQVVLDTEAHGALQRTGAGDRACCLMPLVLQRFCIVEEAQAGGGRHRSALVAGKELAVELGFERLDPMRDGRLGDVQPLGGAVEGAAFHQVEKGFDQFHLHAMRSLCNRFNLIEFVDQ